MKNKEFYFCTQEWTFKADTWCGNLHENIVEAVNCVNGALDEDPEMEVLSGTIKVISSDGIREVTDGEVEAIQYMQDLRGTLDQSYGR